MKYQQLKWTLDDETEALGSGWLFDSGLKEIQKYDDYEGPNPFHSDIEALGYVVYRASGDLLCQKALRMSGLLHWVTPTAS